MTRMATWNGVLSEVGDYLERQYHQDLQQKRQSPCGQLALSEHTYDFEQIQR